MDLGSLARQLGGEVAGHQVLAPGPGHSPRDRSLSVRLSPRAPEGIIVFSHAGDDWRSCRDHVRHRLGTPFEPFRPAAMSNLGVISTPRLVDKHHRARRLWSSARDPRASIVTLYLTSRGLNLPDDIAGQVVRYESECPWADNGNIMRVPSMVAAMRNIHSNAITAAHRTRLTAEGSKVDRRMLGVAAGSAIKLDPDESVSMGLVIGEGIETCLAARQLGFRPVWAVGSVSAIASFPVLAGIEALTILAENDDSGASERAVRACGQRWHDAGREVVVVTPKDGDMNDAVQEGAR